ncbi:MAG TPA: hypothetical protein PK926_14815 [Spirochaetota bacterium]|nr:hypothetical protein [Spirochaetota bacterium]HPI89937.1 hypothetical protein [Spirochaetota bacterium]HPR48464.1 hypothetical protein [Spirochaetota bacterium]
MDAYFEGTDTTGDIEEKIDLLREFIETSDFSALRACDPRYSGEIESDVLIVREGGTIKVRPK